MQIILRLKSFLTFLDEILQIKNKEKFIATDRIMRINKSGFNSLSKLNIKSIMQINPNNKHKYMYDVSLTNFRPLNLLLYMLSYS